MKLHHCKSEFDDESYRLIRIAAAQVGVPIKAYVAAAALHQARIANGLVPAGEPLRVLRQSPATQPGPAATPPA